MKVVDEILLDLFRFAGKCEWCGLRFAILHPHHLFARGMGGGGRMDVRANLVALCWVCHGEHHAGNRPLRCDLLAVVAAREGRTQDEILEELYRVRRTG